jgi:hypothetical protein
MDGSSLRFACVLVRSVDFVARRGAAAAATPDAAPREGLPGHYFHPARRIITH